MNKGGSLPAQQQVALSGLSNLPKLEQSCSWLDTVLNGSVGTIGVNTSANGLAVGQYACDVHVTDALDPNVPGGSTIPVTLVVNATLASDPDGANLVAAKQPQGAVFSITHPRVFRFRSPQRRISRGCQRFSTTPRHRRN
jgi:hypothetical protein